MEVLVPAYIDSLRVIDVMAQCRAIHNIAKVAHWLVKGKDFYEDHLFFDRIAEEFTDELSDKLAEVYYMNNPTAASELLKFNSLVGERSDLSQYMMNPTTLTPAEDFYNTLSIMLTTLTGMLADIKQVVDEGTRVVLDEISVTCAQVSGLISARISGGCTWCTTMESKLVKKSGIKSGLAEAKIYKTLGIKNIKESYKCGKSFVADLNLQLGKKEATRLMKSVKGNKFIESALKKVEEVAPDNFDVIDMSEDGETVTIKDRDTGETTVIGYTDYLQLRDGNQGNAHIGECDYEG